MDKYWFLKNARCVGKNRKILSLCIGKNVLDVGCIGQDIKVYDDNWLHRQISLVANNLDGVDINGDEIDKLNDLGYSIYNFNDLKKNQYDIVIMADVIEHVNNPVSFIQQYLPYINPSGKIVICTPNPNRARNFISILLFNKYGLNEEHTMWFCPKTLSEIIRRLELQIFEFYWVKEINKWKHLRILKKVLVLSELILAYFRNNFYPNFMFIVGSSKKNKIFSL